MSSQANDTSAIVLQELLHQHRTGELEEFDVKANHVPMVLIALYRQGADPDQLRQYFAGKRRTSASKTDSPSARRIGHDDWMQNLGQFSAWRSYRRFFQVEIDERGVQEVLAAHVPPLMAGVAGHAFHPLLRVSYGIDLDDKDEIASGLAYWAAAYLPVPEAPGDTGSAEPVELLNALTSSKSLSGVKPQGNIVERISQFYAQEDFCRLLRRIDLDRDHPLDSIAEAVAHAFDKYHHFTLLHGVTSCHAMRIVLPYCRVHPDAIGQYWWSVCAAYLSVVNVFDGGRQPLPSNRDADWVRVQRDAIATGNEHTIKLAYTCLKESRHYSRAIYHSLARREIDTPASFA